MSTGSLSWGRSGRGVALTTCPHLRPTLKKEYSYTSTFLLDIHGLLLGELYFWYAAKQRHWLYSLAGTLKMFLFCYYLTFYCYTFYQVELKTSLIISNFFSCISLCIDATALLYYEEFIAQIRILLWQICRIIATFAIFVLQAIIPTKHILRIYIYIYIYIVNLHNKSEMRNSSVSVIIAI